MDRSPITQDQRRQLMDVICQDTGMGEAPAGVLLHSMYAGPRSRVSRAIAFYAMSIAEAVGKISPKDDSEVAERAMIALMGDDYEINMVAKWAYLGIAEHCRSDGIPRNMSELLMAMVWARRVGRQISARTVLLMEAVPRAHAG